MFDPTTRLQAARLHGDDLHRSARAHHARRPKLRPARPFGSALRAQAHHLVVALRSPISGASGRAGVRPDSDRPATRRSTAEAQPDPGPGRGPGPWSSNDVTAGRRLGIIAR